MNKKIELLLQAVADFHDFCEDNTSFGALSYSGDELSENELDCIAAARKNPIYTNISLPDKE